MSSRCFCGLWVTEIRPVYAACTYRADYVIAGIVCLGTFWLCCVAESSVLGEIMPVRGSMQRHMFCMYVCYCLLGFGVALLLQYFAEWLVTTFASTVTILACVALHI